MSISAMDQCFKYRRPWWGTSDQMVALAIANNVNPTTGLAWPSNAYIREVTGLSRRRVQEILRGLEKDGTIITAERYLNHRQTTNIYEWMLDYGTPANPIREGRPLAAVPDLFSPTADAAG